MNKLKNKFNGAKFDIEPNGVFASVKLLTTDYMLEFELKKPVCCKMKRNTKKRHEDSLYLSHHNIV